MQSRKVLFLLAVILGIAILVVGGTFVTLYRHVYYIPESAVEDLIALYSRDGLALPADIVPRKRKNAAVYVYSGAEYEENTAELLADERIRATYLLPDGMLYTHYNGDTVVCTRSFRFHYRSAAAGTAGKGVLTSDTDFNTLTAGMPDADITGEAALAAVAFCSRESERARGQAKKLGIEAYAAEARTGADGVVYVACLRRMDGLDITENAVICAVRDGVVTEAAGKWCFFTVGESYQTQLSDILNILFMMRRSLASSSCTGIRSIDGCYSLYYLGGDDGFCLIPCWKIVTDTDAVWIYNGLDGTLYTNNMPDIPGNVS